MGYTATIDAAPPQHMRALERANDVRLARADLKRRVARQELTVVDVIESCPWQAAGMPVSDLLMSQRRWGRARCQRLLRSVSIPENKPIGTLTERQSHALTALLRTRSDQQPAAAGPRTLELVGSAPPALVG